jgi:hypothetical protein
MLKITRHKGGRGLSGGAGLQGPQGLKGDQGIAGIAGVAGAKGDQGIAGVAGAKGDQGIAGVAGAVGAVGEGFYEAMTTLLQYSRTKPEFLNQMMEGIQASRAQIGAANATVWGGEASVVASAFQKFDTVIRRDWDMWNAYMKNPNPLTGDVWSNLGNPQPYLQQGGGGVAAIVLDLKKLLLSYNVNIQSVIWLMNSVKDDVIANINANTEPEGGQTATVIYEVLSIMQRAYESSSVSDIPPATMQNCFFYMTDLLAGNYGSFEPQRFHLKKVIERILKNLEEVSIEFSLGLIDDVAANKQVEATNVTTFTSVIVNSLV